MGGVVGEEGEGARRSGEAAMGHHAPCRGGPCPEGGSRWWPAPPGPITSRAEPPAAHQENQVARQATSPRPRTSHVEQKGVHGRRGATGGASYSYDRRRGRRAERTSGSRGAGRAAARCGRPEPWEPRVARGGPPGGSAGSGRLRRAGADGARFRPNLGGRGAGAAGQCRGGNELAAEVRTRGGRCPTSSPSRSASCSARSSASVTAAVRRRRARGRSAGTAGVLVLLALVACRAWDPRTARAGLRGVEPPHPRLRQRRDRPRARRTRPRAPRRAAVGVRRAAGRRSGSRWPGATCCGAGCTRRASAAAGCSPSSPWAPSSRCATSWSAPGACRTWAGSSSRPARRPASARRDRATWPASRSSGTSTTSPPAWAAGATASSPSRRRRAGAPSACTVWRGTSRAPAPSSSSTRASWRSPGRACTSRPSTACRCCASPSRASRACRGCSS